MRLCTAEFADGSSLARNHGIVGARSANPNWSRTAATLEKHAVVQESSPVCGQYKQARRVCDSLSVTCRSESRQRRRLCLDREQDCEVLVSNGSGATVCTSGEWTTSSAGCDFSTGVGSQDTKTSIKNKPPHHLGRMIIVVRGEHREVLREPSHWAAAGASWRQERMQEPMSCCD